ESEKGFALVMVNLARKPVEKLDLRVRAQGVNQIESIENGEIEFKKEKDYVSFSMPFTELTDIVLMRK
ncbi:MAG: hypothetical protein NC830_01040, partial [Candidatus Omnitrophica bacterium]|nr:hypothetical protein [Candidatus Omnitrophota bacterium]